jgi:hypothetical protein
MQPRLKGGAHKAVCRVLGYLQVTQQADGHWPQNMWLDGGPYWNGIRTDETALPILLVDLARQLYLIEKTGSPCIAWRFNHKIRSMPAGKILRIATMAPAIIHWSVDDWDTVQDDKARDAGLGMHIVDRATEGLPERKKIRFTFYWPDRWSLGRCGLRRPRRSLVTPETLDGIEVEGTREAR